MIRQQGLPYGDAVLISTPEIDKARDEMYQEQRQRNLYQMQENAQLDRQMASQLSRVRSADTPAIIEGYNKYKNIKQQLLFNRKIQRDPQAYNDLNNQANEALGETYKNIEHSAELNLMGKDLLTSRRAHPDVYADDFGKRFQAFQNTPQDQLPNHPLGDLSNPDTFRYGGSNTDFGQVDKLSRGTPHVVYSAKEPVDANGLQTKITPYSYGNSPAQYYQSFLGQVQKHGAARDAAAAWDYISQHPEVIQHVNEQFNAITPEQWKRMTGSDKPQIIEPTDENNKADAYAAFHAKIYAINNLPQEGKPVFRNNQANILQEKNTEQEKLQQNRFKQQKIMEDIRNNNAIGKINLNRLYAGLNEDNKENLVNVHFDDNLSQAKQDKPIDITLSDGGKVSGYEISDPTLAGEFSTTTTTGHKQLPDKMLVSEDGKTYTGVTVTADDKGNSIIKAKQIPVENLKPVFRKFAMGTQKVVPKSAPKPVAPTDINKLRDKYGY